MESYSLAYDGLSTNCFKLVQLNAATSFLNKIIKFLEQPTY